MLAALSVHRTLTGDISTVELLPYSFWFAAITCHPLLAEQGLIHAAVRTFCPFCCMQAARAVELLKYSLWKKNDSWACTKTVRMAAAAVLLVMVVMVTEVMKAMQATEAPRKRV